MSRDCKPANVPLRKSYYYGVSQQALVADTLADVLNDAAQELPDHVVFRVPEFQEQVTLKELKQRAGQVSKSLLASGLKHGDIVLLIGVPDVEFFVLFYAVTQIGLVFLNPQIDAPAEIDTTIYCEVNPRAIFIGKQHCFASVKVVQQYVAKEQQTVIPVVTVNVNAEYERTTSYKDFLKVGFKITDNGLQNMKEQVSVDDIAVLFASSGTSSSKHKIACHTHHSLVNCVKFGRERICPKKNPEVIGFLNSTIDDLNPLLQATIAVYERNVAVMAPTYLNPSPDAVEVFMAFIAKERITWYTGLPTEVIHAVNSPKRSEYDLSCLRGVTLLGQVTSAAAKQSIMKIFPESVTMFGSSEAPAGLGTSSIWSTEEQKVWSVGYPLAHCEVAIFNNQQKIVPIGEQGELCVRGWTVMQKYLNDPELTAAAKDPMKHGWYHYGDICTMDETGHVTYIGRKSECVRFKHFSDTVYPEKILKVAEKDQSIKTAKVVGIPSDEKGDDICLCVEPKPGCTISIDRLKNLMEEHLQEGMRPDYYFVFEDFPRTGARKKIAMNEIKDEVIRRLCKKNQED